MVGWCSMGTFNDPMFPVNFALNQSIEQPFSLPSGNLMVAMDNHYFDR